MPIIVTPNMNLPVPVVGQEAGPQYATDIDSCFSLIDQHNHTPGSGVMIPTGALNINADLPMNNNRLLGIKSSVFSPQGAPLPGSSPDLGALYVSGADLYYNDGAGNQIRITQGGNVVGPTGSITGLTPPASASYSSGSGTFTWQSNINTAAKMDNGPITIRKTSVSSFGTTVNPPSVLSADYSLQLPPDNSTGVNSFVTMDTSNNLSVGPAVANGITRNNLAPVGQQVSASSGTYSTQVSGGYNPITNLSVTITTTGRPVIVILQGEAGNIMNVEVVNPSPSVGALGRIDLFNFTSSLTIHSSSLGIVWSGMPVVSQLFPTTLVGMDLSVVGAPGTYTYTATALVSNGGTLFVQHAVLIAYEL